jgi:hypothetical protein
VIRLTLFGLIIVSAALHAVVSVLAQDTTAAVASLLVGAAWLALEWRGVRGLSWAALLALVIVTVLGSLNDAPMPLVLLALCSAVAAWDLSAFRARTAGVVDDDAKAALEWNHLRKLGITAGAGFVAALIPLVAQFSISFLALCVVLLVAVIALNNVVGTLRGKERS